MFEEEKKRKTNENIWIGKMVEIDKGTINEWKNEENIGKEEKRKK